MHTLDTWLEYQKPVNVFRVLALIGYALWRMAIAHMLHYIFSSLSEYLKPFNGHSIVYTYICIVKVFIHYLKAARAFIFYLIALVFFFRSDIRSMFELPSVNLSINWLLNVIWFTGLFTIRMIKSFFIIFLFREQSYSKKFRVFFIVFWSKG